MDRNVFGFGAKLVHSLSLSARRAWIEIVEFHLFAPSGGSLSARRAWIEIHVRCFSPAGCWVALRKESVDRNLDTMQIVVVVVSRSPQGERG